MIPVTKPFFPPIEEYEEFARQIWKNRWLTNRGELVRRLEADLRAHLGVSWLTITNNGTVPLQIALKLLGKTGEIITTPFSYVATTASIVWENCLPVFVDIHEDYLTIDEAKIEAAITEKTTAIMATHVFGNPCNVKAIETIARKHNLKVIYDAAHCFGVEYEGQSIFNYGDISTCSFHATKLFHTGEGGAMFCRDEELQNQLFYSHNFGHKGILDFHGLGINAKICELQAAMGLAVLPHLNHILEKRKMVVDYYNVNLTFKNYRGIKLRGNTTWNYSYYPIIFDTEEALLAMQKRLNDHDIVPRRYFYPSLNTLNYVTYQEMPVSEKTSRAALCLPLYTELSIHDLEKITNILNE